MTVKHRMGRNALFAVCVLATAQGAALAQSDQDVRPEAPLRLRSEYFGWGASVSPRVGFSDNIDLAPKGLETSAATASTVFSGAAILSRRRFTGVISGDLDLSYISKGRDKFGVNQRVGAASTTTLADNLLYLDVAGSTSRQLLGENARFSANINAARGQRVDVSNYAVSPYFFRKFSNGAVGELRYRFSQVFVGDRRADANPFRGDLLNDSTTQEANAAYQTQQLFQRLRVAAEAYVNRTVEQGSVVAPRFEYQQASGQVRGEFSLTDDFALSGAVGYDDVDTDVPAAPALFNDDRLSGVFWRAGFTAHPGRKTYLRAEYGRRYGKDFVSGEFTYALSRNLEFNAGADRRFQTRAQGVSLENRVLSQETLAFADRLREGDALDPRAIIDVATRYTGNSFSAQTIGLGTFDTAYGRVRGKWGRTEIVGGGSFEDADFGFRRVKSYGADLNVRRQLSRRLTAYGGAFYRHYKTDFDSGLCQSSPFLFGFDVTAPLFDPVLACQDYAVRNGRTDTIGGRVGAQYRIYENLSAFAEYTRTNRLGETPLLEYKENAAFAGVTLEF